MPSDRALEEGSQQQEDEELRERAQDLEENYRNESWTRIISLQTSNEEPIEKWPLGPDLVESMNTFAATEEDEHNTAQIIFDPFAFVEDHPAPS